MLDRLFPKKKPNDVQQPELLPSKTYTRYHQDGHIHITHIFLQAVNMRDEGSLENGRCKINRIELNSSASTNGQWQDDASTPIINTENNSEFFHFDDVTAEYEKFEAEMDQKCREPKVEYQPFFVRAMHLNF